MDDKQVCPSYIKLPLFDVKGVQYEGNSNCLNKGHKALNRRMVETLENECGLKKTSLTIKNYSNCSRLVSLYHVVSWFTIRINSYLLRYWGFKWINWITCMYNTIWKHLKVEYSFNAFKNWMLPFTNLPIPLLWNRIDGINVW